MKTGFLRPTDSNSSVYIDIGDPYPGRDEITAYYPYLQGGLTPQMAFVSGDNTYNETGRTGSYLATLFPQTNVQQSPTVYTGSAGSLHGAKILTDGTLWTWGNGTYGQTGLGVTSVTSTPTQVGADASWKTVNCGFAHTMATKTDGSLWAWGRNNYGQLGNNASLVDQSSPVQIGLDTNWRLIQSGGYHTVALRTDNTIWVWGQNTKGQLGTLDSSHRSSPVQVGTGYTWQSVAAGWLSTYAIRSDGTLWSWGQNLYGQLGANLSTAIDYSSPVQVGSGTNWKKVFAHGGSSVGAIQNDNSAWTWGANTNGQLGLNDRVNRSSPVQLGNQNVWHSVNIGMVHALAIKIDGSLWSWGYNSNGELANNWPTSYSSPIQVGVAKNWKFAVCGGTNSDFFDNSPVIFGGGSAGWSLVIQSSADY
jgi:alpha-tubulin suppressor-like RCC1 family protein